ncbi:hypothetical protein [Streptomyces sp. NPDC127098]|uniref:hypothetical protein n=1 Tax=Streptomyces sp. NPDC127098 TaxID=3347137 RepID=UPI0036525099
MESPRAVITIANRSLDPLTDVSSGFLYEGGYEEGESLGWEVAVTANIESFPPCSEVAIHGQRLAEESGYLQIDVMPEFSIAETASSIIPGEIPLAFTDAAGRSWMRSQEGLQEGDWIVLPGAGSGVEVQRPEVEFTSLSAAQCD